MLSFEFFFSEDAYWLSAIAIFLFGLCWGSFFNVCIWRIPRGESIVFTPSHCPNCGKNIAWFENIPVLSWIVLRGKCSSCKNPISARYILVEILTGCLFAIAYQRVVELNLGLPALIMYVLASSLAILAFIIDIKHRIIPDKINYAVMILALITAFAFPESVGKTSHLAGLINSILGLVVSIVLLGLFAFAGKKVFKKDVMGWGDVKYLGAIGACFGLIPAVWFFTLFIGSIVGMILGFCLMLFAKKSIFAELPFGPFLAIGTYTWILFGPELTEGYFTLISSLLLTFNF